MKLPKGEPKQKKLSKFLKIFFRWCTSPNERCYGGPLLRGHPFGEDVVDVRVEEALGHALQDPTSHGSSAAKVIGQQR